MASRAQSANLQELSDQIAKCRICIECPKGPPLPHEPRPVVRPSSTARILIAGQAPGNKVHQSGVPFTDPSGDRLRDWLQVSSDQFYDIAQFSIIPMGFCFPGYDKNGGDLPPRPECADAWHQRLIAEMPQIKMILAVGLYAQKYYLPDRKKDSLTKRVQDFELIWQETSRDNIGIIPLPHPSWRNNTWIKKNPFFEKNLLPFLREEVGKNIL